MRFIDITPIALEKLSETEFKELWIKMNVIHKTETPEKEEFFERVIFILNEFKRRNIEPENTELLRIVTKFRDDRRSESFELQEERTEYRVRLKNPDDFDPKSYRTTVGGTIYGKIEVPATVNIIWGKLKGKSEPTDKPIPQALRFKVEEWTIEAAKEWLKKNNITYILFETGVQESLEEAVRQPFGSPGGKRYMADRLIRMMPEHKTYVEVFTGGGAVFWRKKPSEKEVLNDKDSDIIMAYRTIKDLTPEQWEELKRMNWKASIPGFAKVKKSFETSTGMKRFHDFIYLRQFSDVGEMKSYDDRDEGKSWAGVNNLMRLHERLKNVTIENMDYAEVIKKYDSPDTFFYIDPPYPSAKLSWKWMPKTEEIESAISGIKGKFLLSYELTKAFSKFNKFTIKLWHIAHPAQHASGAFATEQLVSNYKVLKNATFISESFAEESRHSRDECMDCMNPPTIEVKWAEGMGHAWFCEKHFAIWSAQHKDDIDYIKKVKDGVASEKFANNPNPNIKESIFGKFALQCHWWKDLAESNFGRISEHWSIKIDTGGESFANIIVEKDPLKEKAVRFYVKPCSDRTWLAKGKVVERVDIGDPENLIFESPSWVELIDIGEVTVIEMSDSIMKLGFSGKKLKGLWEARKDELSSGLCILHRSE